MKLSDIANMVDYLANDCYCPGEIYDSTGFFYQIFKPNEDCKLICNGTYKGDAVTAVVCRDQIITFWVNDNKIFNAERYDATENNISEIKALLTGEKRKIKLDEFHAGETKKSIEEIMKYADAIICD